MSFQYEEVQRLVLQYCKGLTADDIEAMMGEANQEKQTELMTVMAELSAKRAKLHDVQVRVDGLMDMAETAGSNHKIKEQLLQRLAQRNAEIADLEQQIKRLETRQNKLSTKGDGFRESLESVKMLGSLLQRVNEAEAVDIRLKLRAVLVNLVEKIVLYPAGRPRYSPEFAAKALKDMAMVHPEGTPEHEGLKDRINERVADPRAFREFDVFFRTGSIRTISPGRKDGPFVMGYDAESKSFEYS